MAALYFRNEEHSALILRLETCRCSLRDLETSVVHGVASESPPVDPDTLLRRLCSTVAGTVEDLPVGMFRKLKKSTAPDAQLWPIGQEDIIPGPSGSKGAISALLRWPTPPTGHAIFPLLGDLARFWEPFARELFRTPPAFALAIDHLQIALDNYDVHAPEDPAATLAAVDPMFDRMRAIAVKIIPIVKGIGYKLDGACSWFERIHKLPTLSPEDQILGSETNYPVRMFSSFPSIRNMNQCMDIGCEAELGVRTTVCSRCAIVCYCNDKYLQLMDAMSWNSWVVRTSRRETSTYFGERNLSTLSSGSAFGMASQLSPGHLDELDQQKSKHGQLLLFTVELLPDSCTREFLIFEVDALEMGKCRCGLFRLDLSPPCLKKLRKILGKYYADNPELPDGRSIKGHIAGDQIGAVINIAPTTWRDLAVFSSSMRLGTPWLREDILGSLVITPVGRRLTSALSHVQGSSGSTKLLRHIHSKGGTFLRMHGTLAPSPAHQPGKCRACEQRRNNRLAVGILKETWLTVTDWKILLDAALKAVVFQI
ncbi:hypothetical protein B0H10DRAFT_1943755 [Mycena sp. CBHHK59/15]|nr:hypothetical protein B0H10DRAFT_1943755 [Mycena sp. CBHHK59/15]